MYKKVNVIILPSKNGNSKIGLNPQAMFNKPHLYYFNEGAVYHECQHLYITSDEKIKAGDWFLTDIRDNKSQNNGKPLYEVQKCTQIVNGWIFTEQDSELGLNPSWSKKIIATTDTSLISINEQYFDVNKSRKSAVLEQKTLPKIPQRFIKKFIEEYNKGNQIEEIFVEYVQELSISSNGQFIEEEAYLKINSDNTISIRNKINYSIEEVEEIIRRCAFYFINNPPSNSENILQVSNQWIKENL